MRKKQLLRIQKDGEFNGISLYDSIKIKINTFSIFSFDLVMILTNIFALLVYTSISFSIIL